MENTVDILNEDKACEEPFDYAKWRRDNLYENLSLSELNRKAAGLLCPRMLRGQPLFQKIMTE